MQKAVKIAVSMSNEDFETIEAIRKHTGTTRSGVVTKAIRLLGETSRKESLIRRYEQGYKKHPEKKLEIEALEKAAVETLSDEGW